MQGTAGGVRAMLGAAITALVLAGCGGGGGGSNGDSGGGPRGVPGGGNTVKSADYWYDDPDTIVVFSRFDRYGAGSATVSTHSGIVRLVPTGRQVTADGPVMGWAVRSVSPDYWAAEWNWAMVRDDGIHTSSSTDPQSVGAFEVELPAALVHGSVATWTTDTNLYDERTRALYPARLTVTTRATRIDSLALTRFSVPDVLKVERDFRYVPLEPDAAQTIPVVVAKESIWYGRGLGPVKSELLGLAPEGRPVPAESHIELRGLRSPTRAVGVLPGVAAIDRKTLREAMVASPGLGLASEEVSESSAYASQPQVAGGTSGFMLAANFAVSPVQADPLQPSSPGPEGLVLIATDQAGRHTAMKFHPVANPIWPHAALETRGLAFDGSRYWVLGLRSVSASEKEAFLARASEDGELLDPIDLAGMAGCGIRVSPNAVLASNRHSVVIADSEFHDEDLSTIPFESQYVRTSRIRWCAYDRQRQVLVSGLSSPVQSAKPTIGTSAVRLTVSDTGTYVVSMSMSTATDATDAVPSYAEIVLDANGNALESTPRVVAGRAPQNFGSPSVDRWPGIVDLGGFASLAPSFPDPKVALSGSGSLAIPHREASGSDAPLVWSLLIPEQAGW